MSIDFTAVVSTRYGSTFFVNFTVGSTLNSTLTKGIVCVDFVDVVFVVAIGIIGVCVDFAVVFGCDGIGVNFVEVCVDFVDVTAIFGISCTISRGVEAIGVV